jgi:ABC-type antimicrobial peptide transport system permease subunit
MASYQARVRRAGVYFPLVPGTRDDLNVLLRGRVDPLTIVPRIREVAMSVDPSLRIEQMTRLDQLVDDKLWIYALWLRVTGGLTAVALLLSLSGIYSVMSYTVARRTREIGVRIALGASARRVITSIFRRPLIQVVGGVVAGSILIALGTLALQGSEEFAELGRRGLTIGQIATLVGYAGLMVGVCMLACVVPTMRALRVQPTEALRAE